MKNRIIRMPEKQHFVIEEGEMPHARRGAVVVRIEYCGICGSDMHFFKDGAIGIRKAPPNFILGHECAGTVVEIGEDVTDLKVGDRVALEPGLPCGKCEFCRKGQYNLCRDMHFMAAAMPPTQGALRDYIQYPAEWCFKLPDNVSTMEGAMIEPLSVGMHAASRGEVGMGKSVLLPQNACSRAQIMTILGRTLTRGYSYSPCTFADADMIPDWSRDHIDLLTSLGIITGGDGGKVDPLGTITRAQFAALLYRMY